MNDTDTAYAAPAADTHVGTLHLPTDESYDRERLAWNLTADQRPAAVYVVRSVAQVQAALAYAREHGLTVATQTTGHTAQLLPDLGRTLLLKPALHDGHVDVDPVARVARVDAGALWGEVVEAVSPHGLAVMHGSSPTVGVIGYLLGGGLSYYARQHGLAATHVRALEVVTPDGTHRRVDADHDPELFYALRGGGGGYAVVCAVEIDLLPYAEVTGGALFFDLERLGDLLRTWHDWARTAPTTITTTFRVLRLPPLPAVPEPLRGVPTVCVDGVDLAGGREAARLESLLREVATPVLGGFGPMPSAAVARLHGDPEDPLPGVGSGTLLRELDEGGLDAFVEAATGETTLLAAELRQLGGALSTAPVHAGARGHLEGSLALFAVTMATPTMPEATAKAAVDRLRAAMRPWETGTGFVNFEEQKRSLETLVPPDALDRVTAVRAHVDPDGLLVASHLPPTRA